MSNPTHPEQISPGRAEAEAPEFGGVRLGQTVTITLYALLVASALLSFFGRTFPGSVPAVIEKVVPWVFLAFLAAFAFYRLGLVRARKYPAFKAFFQIGLVLVVWVLLFPSNRTGFPAAEEGLDTLITDANPKVRALAAEVARYRPRPARYGGLLVRALEDPDEHVRAEAHASLVHITGNQDLGSPEDPKALQAWKERYP